MTRKQPTPVPAGAIKPDPPPPPFTWFCPTCGLAQGAPGWESCRDPFHDAWRAGDRMTGPPPSPSGPRKSARIELRLTESDRRLLGDAATVCGKSFSEFIRDASMEAAKAAGSTSAVTLKIQGALHPDGPWFDLAATTPRPPYTREVVIDEPAEEYIDVLHEGDVVHVEDRDAGISVTTRVKSIRPSGVTIGVDSATDPDRGGFICGSCGFSTSSAEEVLEHECPALRIPAKPVADVCPECGRGWGDA